MKNTYTMIIHRLGKDYSLNLEELSILTTIQNISNANGGDFIPIKHEILTEICLCSEITLRRKIAKLIKNGLLLRGKRSHYKTASQFRRDFNKYRFEIQEDNGYKANMKVLKNERQAV